MIDVTVLADTHSVDAARLALRQHGIAHGLLGVRTARHERANDIVLEAADNELLHVAALNVVLTAAIDDTETRAILSGNAAPVFDLAEQPFALPAPTSATNLIDVHGHFGALGLPTPVLCPADQVAMAREHGIVLTVASSLLAIADDVAIGNAEAFAAASGALRASVVVGPNDLAASCRAMDNAYAWSNVFGW